MAAKRRELTDIVMSGLLAVLCAGLGGWSPAVAQEQVDELKSEFKPGAEFKSEFRPGAVFLPRPPTAPPPPASPAAQPAPGAQPGTPAGGAEEDKTINMIADEVGHDENLGIFVARGNVEILREGRVVKADVVTYNERTGRITAAGNVVLIEPDGDIQFATYADVTDDVKEGILYDFRMLLKDNARLAANRAYRVEQDTKEILRKGVYTPCAPCAEDPSRSPLWQVKAYSAIRDKVNKTITYHDAWLEMFGVPVLYLPWFRHPDFGVDRQSGLLSPELHYSSKSGVQIATPYYHVLAPDKDITFTPILTFGGDVQDRPGAVAMLEYRQRVIDGRFRLEGSATVENRETDEPNEEDRRVITNDFRGHIEGDGLFDIDEDWRAGFDFKAATDKSYLRRFHLGSRDILTQNAYVEGFFGRSYAEAQGYAFQTTDDDIINDELPIIAPMLDYRFVGEPGVAGGYWGMDANFMNLRRVDGREVVRLAANPYWTLPYTSSLGDMYRLTLEVPMTMHAVHDVDPDSDIRNPTGDTFDGTVVRALPKASFDWRYPFVRPSPTFTQVIEPLFQVVAAPDSGNTGEIPNEDSRAFELDDTNLFLADRFPGLDRKDTGSRATYGAQWSAYTPYGGYANAFLGQSFQFEHDDNDEFRTGTGIDDDLTDAVGRLQFRPIPGVDLNYRFRFDAEDVAFQRHEVGATYVNFDPYFVLSGSYAFIAADGVEFGDREQVGGYIGTNLSQYWSANLRSAYDLEGKQLLSVGGGLRYLDECFDLNFDITYAPGGDTEESEGEVNALFTINFRNLGGLDIPY